MIGSSDGLACTLVSCGECGRQSLAGGPGCSLRERLMEGFPIRLRACTDNVSEAPCRAAPRAGGGPRRCAAVRPVSRPRPVRRRVRPSRTPPHLEPVSCVRGKRVTRTQPLRRVTVVVHSGLRTVSALCLWCTPRALCHKVIAALWPRIKWLSGCSTDPAVRPSPTRYHRTERPTTQLNDRAEQLKRAERANNV